MNIQIVSDTKKPLLSRRDVAVKLEFAGTTTPSRAQMKDIIAKALNADAKLISLYKVKNDFGSSSVSIIAQVYDNEKTLKTLQEKHLEERDTGKKAAEETKEEAK